MACSRALLALLLASAAFMASARPLSSEELELAPGRKLLALTACPKGCTTCVKLTNTAYRCDKCAGKLSVLTATTANVGSTLLGTCGCVAGFYSNGALDCTACPKGSVCPGVSLGLGAAGTSNTQANEIKACTSYTNGAGLTTLAARSTKATDCVNAPGYRYITPTNNGGQPGAAQCASATFSAGLLKQQTCDSCPSGFVEKTGTAAAARTSSAICTLPAGYYLKSAGVGAPCPKGEYKAGQGLDPSCTPCGTGISTPATASPAQTACTVLLAGYKATLDDANTPTKIVSAVQCPQKFWCPGYTAWPAGTTADPKDGAKPCSGGLWTKAPGAKSVGECLLPPGFAWSGSAATKCSSGFRANWVRPTTTAIACSACGTGVSSDPQDELTVYNADGSVGTPETVASTPASCFIPAGFGMTQFVAPGGVTAYRARACTNNEYGSSAATYGLKSNPCRACPSFMVTNATAYPATAQYKDNASGGYTDPLACVTAPGYGYNGRAATKCAAGSYNEGGNYDDCSTCDFGKATGTAGTNTSIVGSAAALDCNFAPGFGADPDDNAKVIQCPVGTYADTFRAALAECTGCPGGFTTADEGSDSAGDCSYCSAGYGGSSCGACLAGAYSADGTYTSANKASFSVGATDADPTPSCEACPGYGVQFQFSFAGVADAFAPGAVADAAAKSAAQCYLRFAQAVDDEWFLPVASPAALEAGTAATTMAACAATCASDADCHFVTLDYSDATTGCKKYVGDASSGSTYIAYKVGAAADVGSASIKSLPASGRYTQFKDANALGVGKAKDGSALVLGTADDRQACMQACDADTECAAVVMAVDDATKCALVFGDATIDVGKRTVARADPTKFAVLS